MLSEMRLAVFAYGSLMIPSSATRALGREIREDDYEPALLKRHRRTWRVRVPLWSGELGEQVAGVFLDVRPGNGFYLNGLLLEISQSELASLRLREAQYVERDVTDEIDCASGNQVRVVTFVGRPAYCRDLPPMKSHIPQRYLSRIERACKRRGKGFLQEFHETTDRARFPAFNGAYKFISSAQARRV